jgi:hypothetical protein
LCFDDNPICQYHYWAFASCAVATLEGFKFYGYIRTEDRKTVTNFHLMEEHHDALFKWLKTHSPGGYNACEYLMVLSQSQIRCLPKTLAHPCVKQVDQWTNKAHDGNMLHLYRISLEQDFQ